LSVGFGKLSGMQPRTRQRADSAAREAAVLGFWRTVELFSPQTVSKLSHSGSTDRPVITVGPGESLPWERRYRPRTGKVWRHTVYLGVYRIAQVYDVLREIFEPDEDSYDARTDGVTALAAVQVSQDGQVLWGTELLSSCAWATGRARQAGRRAAGWLDGLGPAQQELTALMHSVTCPQPADGNPGGEHGEHEVGDAVGPPVTLDTLLRLRERVATMLGVADVLDCAEVRIKSVLVKAGSDPTGGSDFLNSFIAEDLARVAEQAAAGNVGAALHAYLSEETAPAIGRVDLDDPSSLAFVRDAVAPSHIPLGRWPAEAQQPLALSQQLAVSQILDRLSPSAGLFAVNGPPGTGKTTMLRELLAAVVVQRACRLAELSHPGQAFVGAPRLVKMAKITWRVPRWSPQLTGFEIVIASANNGAVQNVTDEIPVQTAIAESWRDHIDHFTDIATALLAVDEDGEDNDEDADSVVAGNPTQGPRPLAWGLIAGRLGNKKNRRKFASALWFADSDPIGLNARLKQLRGSAVPWPAAVAEFTAARRRVEDAADDRTAVQAALIDLPAQQAAWQQHKTAASTADQLAAEHDASAARLDAELHTASASHGTLVQRRREHHEFKPSWIRMFTSAGRRLHREWVAIDTMLQDDLWTSGQAIDKLTTRRSEVVTASATARQSASESGAAAAEASQRADALTSQIDTARQRWQSAVPDDDWWDTNDADKIARRERAAPWLDAEFNRARTELFLAALTLHRTFMIHEADSMRHGLGAATDILVGKAPADLDPEAAMDAWRALFFAVPIVSTTFASFDRVFRHLGRETLGWLFIDEAGQATPQQAVGGIWRSRRVVVVGDPLQLEPVLTIPFTTQQAIRNDHGASEAWLPARTSVQKLADRLTPVGTNMETRDGPIWVGCPLRVHRRCDDPMFSIANQVAYRGRMIQAPLDRPPLELHPSAWFDIAGHTAAGHYLHEEGRLLRRLLDQLVEHRQDMSQVFVITPFRDVAQHLSDLPDRYGKKLRTGTIHTAQGKEADVVFLVLGGDPTRDGAKSWAAGPNLINVAVSRAKRRLYVIGNRRQWTLHANLKIVAQPPMTHVCSHSDADVVASLFP